jgi:hypothetical protein
MEIPVHRNYGYVFSSLLTLANRHNVELTSCFPEIRTGVALKQSARNGYTEMLRAALP